MRLRNLWIISVLLAGCAEGTQTEACRAYLDCLAARDQQLGITTNAARFESDGACWGSPTGAELCDTACVRGLEFIGGTDDAPTECTP